MIDIGNDFSRYPGGRYRRNGRYSGEEFRDELLKPALREAESVVVVLDNTIGYGSSFLEEAFGGLVRAMQDAGEDVSRRVKLESDDDLLIKEIVGYMAAAKGG